MSILGDIFGSLRQVDHQVDQVNNRIDDLRRKADQALGDEYDRLTDAIHRQSADGFKALAAFEQRIEEVRTGYREHLDGMISEVQETVHVSESMIEEFLASGSINSIDAAIAESNQRNREQMAALGQAAVANSEQVLASLQLVHSGVLSLDEYQRNVSTDILGKIEPSLDRTGQLRRELGAVLGSLRDIQSQISSAVVSLRGVQDLQTKLSGTLELLKEGGTQWHQQMQAALQDLASGKAGLQDVLGLVDRTEAGLSGLDKHAQGTFSNLADLVRDVARQIDREGNDDEALRGGYGYR